MTVANPAKEVYFRESILRIIQMGEIMAAQKRVQKAFDLTISVRNPLELRLGTKSFSAKSLDVFPAMERYEIPAPIHLMAMANSNAKAALGYVIEHNPEKEDFLPSCMAATLSK